MTSMRLRLVFCLSFVDHLLLLCCGAVQWWGGGGGMTSMRMRLVFSFCFVDLFLLCGGAVQWWGGGGGDDVRLVFSFSFVDLLLPLLVASVLVVISGYLLLGFPHVDHAKTSLFLQLSRQKTNMPLKLNLKKGTKSMVFATLSQNLPKIKNEEHWKTKTPTHRVADENLAKYNVFLISTKTSQK